MYYINIYNIISMSKQRKSLQSQSKSNHTHKSLHTNSHKSTNTYKQLTQTISYAINNNLIEVVYKNKQEQTQDLSSMAVYFEDTRYTKTYLTYSEIKQKHLTVLNYMGFNFSSEQIDTYIQETKDTLFKDKFRDILSHFNDRYYFVSYIQGDTNTRDHELAHYEFWNNTQHNKTIQKLIQQGLCNTLTKEFLKLGYSEDVIPTEIYAFTKIEDKTLPLIIKREISHIKRYIL